MNGLKCALSLGSSFAFPVVDMVTTNDYTDAAGWNQNKYQAFGFLKLNTNDNHLDVCARGKTGAGTTVGLTCAFAP
jgi:hypothetical protein